jgi:biopolymer transport protein TolQ
MLTNLFTYDCPFIADANVFDYFWNSNFAGKCVIFALFGLSIYAWSLIYSKYSDLRKLKHFNARHEKKIHELPSLMHYDDALFKGEGGPFLRLVSRAMEAYRKHEKSGGENHKARMKQVENALRRTLSELTDRYEDKMIYLATIVSGAPFLGLLGTVWGVMDAFGSMEKGGATIDQLAPGVSGALLTTVAALLVAIPTVFIYNSLLSSTRSEITRLENFASLVHDRIELDSAS